MSDNDPPSRKISPMWFRTDQDPRQLFRAMWYMLRWVFIGPLIGGIALGLFGLFLAGSEGMINGGIWGLLLGVIGGVMTAAAHALAHWDS